MLRSAGKKIKAAHELVILVFQLLGKTVGGKKLGRRENLIAENQNIVPPIETQIIFSFSLNLYSVEDSSIPFKMWLAAAFAKTLPATN